MSSRKHYRPWAPDQTFLLPPSPRDWLPAEHLAYFILDVADTLDLSVIVAVIQAKDPRGTQPYDPRLMVALLLYGYCTGVRSSRAIERATHEDIPFRVIAGGCQPDHATISEFRRHHLSVFRGLFLQALRMCQEAGLVKLGHVALDGTKMPANASKHKAMSYERMKRTEAELSAEVEKLLAEAEQADATEDAKYGKDRRGDELPAELARRQSRLEKLRAARAALEAEAARTRAETVAAQAEAARRKVEMEEDEGKRETLARAAERAKHRAAEAAAFAETQANRAASGTSGPQHAEASDAAASDAASAPVDNDPVQEEPKNEADPLTLPRHRVPATKEGLPKDKAQRNFTDPESRILKKGNDYLQGYNCQIVVDAEHQIIVGQAVTNQAPDVEHLPPLLQQAVDNCGKVPEVLSGDSGYFSANNVAFSERLGADPHLAVRQQKHQERDSEEDPLPLPDDSEARKKMADKLRTPEGKATYARRKAIVEPVFGQMKEPMGFRRFLLRGLDKVRGEWDLAVTAHNFLKLFRSRTAPPRQVPLSLGPVPV